MKTCIKCKKHHTAQTAYCNLCLKKKRERARTRREKWSLSGTDCVECGKSRLPDCRLCSKCRERSRKSAHNRRVKLRSAGLCVKCKAPSNGKKHCEPCGKLSIEWNNKRRAELTEEGKCIQCYTELDIPDSKYCSRCVVKSTARTWLGSAKKADKLFQLMEDQGGTCPYTGEALTPGVNAEIDHRIPRKRGGSDDIDNLQWASKTANRSKQDMTHDEYIEHCRLVASRFPLTEDPDGDHA